MARPESVAVAGYYPTPTHLLPRLAALLCPIPVDVDSGRRPHVAFVDPCAGDTTAIREIMHLVGSTYSDDLYACEMEATRWNEAKNKSQGLGNKILHGDAFHVVWEKREGAGLLFLNPPYDLDPVFGRLEHRFLDRFASTLTSGGVLMFLVPFYALAASAELIGREFEDVRCFRFPGKDFDVFKQVVVIARKSEPLTVADPTIEAQVRAWSMSGSTLPELPEEGVNPLYTLPGVASYYEAGFREWSIRPLDLKSLLSKARPWMQTTRGATKAPVSGVLPALPVQELLLRTYPVATPPRPAHIAVGMASGIFNGSRIDPEPDCGLPPLLVKGVFDREYRTVEEKINKDGDLVGLVQVQQPKLVTTVLDLETHKYHVLNSELSSTKRPTVESMTVADLLQNYKHSLMSVMERQCPIMYDPRRDAGSVVLPTSPRKLFTAQGHAVRALVKLLGGVKLSRIKRKGKAAILLGEIGSGKTTVSLMVAKTIKARRMLVVCPPHLLTSWVDEIVAVLPEAEVRILNSVTDLERASKDEGDGIVISILSREAAKLTHGWIDAGEVCPKCGASAPDVTNQARKRLRCEHMTVTPRDALARLCQKWAIRLAKHDPKAGIIHSLLSERMGRRFVAHYAARGRTQENGEKTEAPAFPGFKPGELDGFITAAVNSHGKKESEAAKIAIVLALAAAGDHAMTARVAHEVIATESTHTWQSFGRDLLLLLPPGGPEQMEVVNECMKTLPTYWSNPWTTSVSSHHSNPWVTFKGQVERIGKDAAVVGKVNVLWANGKLTVNGKSPNDLSSALDLLRNASHLAKFKRSRECGEHLYQAVPEPRRASLAQRIKERYPDLFDFLVLDEGHEYATEGSAQERAAHRLTSLGIPTVLQTGSIMNGYAKSMFTNMWALSPDFRAEFAREDGQVFVDRYGYRKRLVQEKHKDVGEVIEFGSNSDRVTRSERIIGEAPGILPLFLLRYLLPISVTLHKSDLAIDLPKCTQEKVLVQPDSELLTRYKRLQSVLTTQIKKDRFDKEKAGKLFGQLAELPSYLDRATKDTGNSDSGCFEIAYPESAGGDLVVSQPPFPASNLLGKEAWLVQRVTAELAEGRNVMVFSWHTNLLPRLARLLAEGTGEKVAILYSDKVPTAKRQDWITKEVVSKGRRILVVNPVAVQTGLNNLVHFHTEIWMENPACNPTVKRQAEGRVDRIGQKLETRIVFPIYADTLQVQLYDLLAQKVAVAISTDGLDPESALQAAGVGEDNYLVGLSIGKQIWAMLSAEGEDRVARKPAVRKPAVKGRKVA